MKRRKKNQNVKPNKEGERIMQTRTKIMAFRVILVLVVCLFAGGYFYQNQLDKKETTVQKDVQQETTAPEVEETPSPEPEEATIPKEVEGKSLSEFYSNEDIEGSKKVSESFVKALYQVDGNDIQKGVNNALPFTTENLKKMMQSEEGAIIRPTADFFSREVKEIKVEEPDVTTNEFITWFVTVKGEIKNKDGKVTDQDETTYLLQAVKENNVYKISEYSVNPNK